jgi:hypothetical protein|nr:MAG TPA: hypothetical protein [Caudoviricetes sp.]
MRWKTYGTGVGYTLEQVEAAACALEDGELVEYSTQWLESVRQMRAAEIIHKTLGTGAEIELPNGIVVYIEEKTQC